MTIKTNEMIYLLPLCAVIISWGIYFYALKNPEKKWVRILYSPRGPRTNVKFMTKNELMTSGVQYFIYAFFLFILTFALTYFVSESNIVLSGMWFASLILFATFFFGGLYMLMRGLFRKKNYIPPGYIKNIDK